MNEAIRCARKSGIKTTLALDLTIGSKDSPGERFAASMYLLD
ncbi:hypothetical protein [Bradyrhizobium sp. 139]|nr:hypothetical protein [Bradyrhizobium sp. 139]